MKLREMLGRRPCEALFMLFPLQQEFCPPWCLAEGVVIYCTCCTSCFPLSVSNISIRVAA